MRVLARDRPKLHHLGAPEAAFTRAWMDTWVPIRTHVRSQVFLDQLGPNPTPLMMSAVAASVIDNQVPFLHHALARVLRQVMLNQRPRSATQILLHKDAYPSPLAPNPTYPERYIVAANRLVGDLIEGITADQKRRVIQIVSQAFREGKNPNTVAVELGNLLGLNARWSTAVQRLYDTMLNNGISQAVADRRANTYSEYLLKKRGAMVARTEMMRAMNAGRFEAFGETMDDRGQNPTTVVKRWIVGPGACPECVMTSDPEATGEPQAVIGYWTPFETPYGPVLYPPLHPHCRCNILYR